MAVGTLGLVAWAEGAYGVAVAHTMGLATFSIFNVFFSLETADEERTLLSSQLLENPVLLRATAFSAVAIVAATELGLLQRLLDTVDLDTRQWGLCLLVAASILVICEVKKLLRIRTDVEPEPSVASLPSSS